MIANGYVDSNHSRVLDTEKFHEHIKVLNYSTGPSITPDEATSSTELYNYYNPLAAKTVYLTVSGTSSSTNVVVPSHPWYVYSPTAKTLVYPNLMPLADLTRVAFSEEEQQTYGIDEQYDQVFRTIGQLVTLPENWDSYGGKPIKEHCIRNAFEILQYILELRDNNDIEVPTPFVAPISSGGIQIEWEVGDRYLQIDLVPESSEIEYFAIDRTFAGDLSLEGPLISMNNLRELLIWFSWGKTEDLGDLYFGDFDTELAA